MTDKAILQAKMSEGREAERLLEELDPYFQQIQGSLLDKIANAVRQGEDEKAVYRVACRLTELDDLFQEIYETARTGARALKTATEMEKSNVNSTAAGPRNRH